MNFSPETEAYIDHEVRLRTLNSDMTNALKRLDDVVKRIDALDQRIEDKFNIMLGMVIVGVLLPIALHAFRLI